MGNCGEKSAQIDILTKAQENQQKFLKMTDDQKLEFLQKSKPDQIKMLYPVLKVEEIIHV